MADTDKPQKINIGFLGGPVLSARVAPAELAKLRSALESGAWHDLEAQESTVALDCSKIVYVLVDNEAHQVGFGG